MSDTPISIMIDTNVWVDSFCGWHMRAPEAKRLLSLAQRSGYELLYPVHSLKDIVYLLTQEYKRKAREEEGQLTSTTGDSIKVNVVSIMRSIMELATAVGADVSDLWLADKYLPIHGDFEDNLVLAACQRARADYLVTNDQALISHADVVAKTPEDMVRLIEAKRVRKQGRGFAPSETWQHRKDAWLAP